MSYCYYTAQGEVKCNNNITENFAVSTNGKCGPTNDYNTCPTGQCCSDYGFCGGTHLNNSSACNYSKEIDPPQGASYSRTTQPPNITKTFTPPSFNASINPPEEGQFDYWYGQSSGYYDG